MTNLERPCIPPRMYALAHPKEWLAKRHTTHSDLVTNPPTPIRRPQKAFFSDSLSRYRVTPNDNTPSLDGSRKRKQKDGLKPATA